MEADQRAADIKALQAQIAYREGLLATNPKYPRREAMAKLVSDLKAQLAKLEREASEEGQPAP